MIIKFKYLIFRLSLVIFFGSLVKRKKPIKYYQFKIFKTKHNQKKPNIFLKKLY